MRTATENTNHCPIFLREIFCVIIVLCLNILRLKAVNEITAMQTRTSLRKHDVIKVCSIEYLTTQIDSLLPTFKSWTVHKRIYNVRTIVWPLNIYRSTTAFFFEPPCIYVGIVWLYYLLLMSEVCKTVFSCLTFADVAYPSVRPSFCHKRIAILRWSIHLNQGNVSWFRLRWRIETSATGRIELIFGTETSFHLSGTVLQKSFSFIWCRFSDTVNTSRPTSKIIFVRYQ